MKLRICLAGATGQVGQEVVKGIMKTPEMELVACLGSSTSGKQLSRVLPFPCPDLLIHSSVESALEQQPFDVLIDYTTPESVYETITHCIASGVNCVIGTSGLSDEQYDRLNRLALDKGVGVFAAGNLSITAALMMHFSQIAAKFVPHWELIDYASHTKPDAPSGTSRELAYLLGKVGRPEHGVLPKNVHGDVKSRGAEVSGTQVHSVRIPGFYFASEAIFGLPDERISIRHDSMGGAPYVEGTLLAAKEVSTMKGVVRSMGKLLGLHDVVPGEG